MSVNVFVKGFDFMLSPELESTVIKQLKLNTSFTPPLYF